MLTDRIAAMLVGLIRRQRAGPQTRACDRP